MVLIGKAVSIGQNCNLKRLSKMIEKCKQLDAILYGRGGRGLF